MSKLFFFHISRSVEGPNEPVIGVSGSNFQYSGITENLVADMNAAVERHTADLRCLLHMWLTSPHFKTEEIEKRTRELLGSPNPAAQHAPPKAVILDTGEKVPVEGILSISSSPAEHRCTLRYTKGGVARSYIAVGKSADRLQEQLDAFFPPSTPDKLRTGIIEADWQIPPAPQPELSRTISMPAHPAEQPWPKCETCNKPALYAVKDVDGSEATASSNWRAGYRFHYFCKDHRREPIIYSMP